MRSVAKLMTFFLVLQTGMLWGCKSKSAKPIVAITQIVSHPALDKVHQGVVDELASSGYHDGKDIELLFQNPQGNMATAAQIAKQFVSRSPHAIVAISTPSAQAVLNAAKGKAIPVIFATVTDPVEARLVQNLQRPGGLVTGTRNAPPMDKEMALIKAVLPDVKTVGLLINFSEANSVILLNAAKEAAKVLGIAIEVAPVQSSADVPAAAQSLVGRANAILLLQDNTVASALAVVIKAAQAAKIPLFTTYLDAIPQGALAGLAFDEYAIGRQTGKIVVRILRGEKPGDIAVEDPREIEVAVNESVAERLGIALDANSLKNKLDLKP